MTTFLKQTQAVILSRADGEGSRNRSARSAPRAVGHVVTASHRPAHRKAVAPTVRSFAVFAAQDDRVGRQSVEERFA